MDGKFQHNTNNPLPFDLLIVDEASMMGTTIFSDFLSAVNETTTVVIVGDADQLPSVDYGKCLDDMINSQRIPYTALNEVYRQKSGSSLAERILDVANNSHISLEESSDFKFIETIDDKSAMNSLIANYTEALSRCKDIREIAVLSPVNTKGELSVDNVNAVLQEHVNPSGMGRKEIVSGKTTFRVGDIVIQGQNEAAFEVFNGMVGVIKHIETAKTKDDVELIEVHYPDSIVEYTRDRFNKIKLAYALTIHRTQGSEYSDVILVAPDEYSFLYSKRLFYTGISRAKNRLCVIGNERCVNKALENNSSIDRRTFLKELIKERNNTKTIETSEKM